MLHSRSTLPVARVVVLMAVGLRCSAHAEEGPSNGGMLRLARDWRWCEWETLGSEPGQQLASIQTLTATSSETLDMDRLAGVVEEAQDACDRVLWKAFHVPEEWRGRQVWFTVDVRRLSFADACGVWLNGQRLSIGLARWGRGGFHSVRDLDDKPSSPSPRWILDVGTRLVFDRPNLVAVRVQKWPVGRNSGAWLYCPPRKEKVLFLQSRDVSNVARGAVSRYAAHVARLFAVEPIVRTRSFQKPDDLRACLREHHNVDRISGAVIIGSHPFASFCYAGGKQGGLPRFYEDLDAVFTDSDGDGILDTAKAPDGFGVEIWVSWLRIVPTRRALFAGYLQKLDDYYEGRMLYPAITTKLPVVTVLHPGLDHFDLFMRPGHLATFTAHGGGVHIRGPCKYVSWDLALDMYPGSLVVGAWGCQGGNLAIPNLRIAEAYLLGRSNCLLAFSGARSGGGYGPFMCIGMQDEVLNISAHFGAYYTFMLDLAGAGHFSYLRSGYIMLGNPFVDFGAMRSGPYATVRGKVLARTRDSEAGPFYVSASRDGKCFGRVATAADGSYELACLPPGRYDVRLHLNPLESYLRSVKAGPAETIRLDWPELRLWQVKGQISDQEGQPNNRGWAQVAAIPLPEEFERNRLLNPRTDRWGRFQVFGSKPMAFWIRARHGGHEESKPVRVFLKQGEVAEGLRLKHGPAADEHQPGLGWTAKQLLSCEPKITRDLPRTDGIDAEADITDICIGLVGLDDLTTPRRGKLPAEFCDSRTFHNLRLGIRVAQPLPDDLSDAVRAYLWEVMVRKQSFTFQVTYRPNFSRWVCAVRAPEGPTPRLWETIPVWVTGPWVFIDLTPFIGGERLDWRVRAKSVLRGGKWGRDSAPANEGWYRIRASLAEEPQLVVTRE